MIPVLMLFCSLALLGDTTASKTEKEVLAAMNAWKQAMLTRDRAALEALYAPRLIYVHSSGKQENKAEAIEAVVNGEDRFESIDMEDVTVSIYGSTALVKAKVILRINNGTATSTLTLDILHVWIKTASKWQMAARHALRLNPS
jgi:ketosteroid isomerase-like protein